MKFEKILNEIKRLNQARKNNIRLNAGSNEALYEMNRYTIKAELKKLEVKNAVSIEV